MVKVLAVAIALIWPAPLPFTGESVAQAGTRLQTVRPGDRSRMRLLRAPTVRQRQAILRRLAARPTHPGARRGQRYQEQHQWFWAMHGAGRGAASAARWFEPVDTLRRRRAAGKGMIARATMLAIAREHGALIADAARRHKVSEALVLAVMAVESGGKVTARSPKDAQGLMQLIPDTARRFGVADSYDPRQNIAGGVAYLDWLLATFDGDAILALAGYNAGENAVIRHDGVPPYAETRDYVVKVLDALVAAEGLCPTPPQGPRRPCAWGPELHLAPAHRADDRAPPPPRDPMGQMVLPPPRPDPAAIAARDAAEAARDVSLPDNPPPGNGAS